MTVKTLPLPEDPGELENVTLTKYTKHYYIGSERINSALGTIKSLGLLCEGTQIPIPQWMIDDMNQKVKDAGTALIATHQAFDKTLVLPEPFLYSSPFSRCDKVHDYDKYAAYWYHPDHLGSSNYITNLDGEISQHMEYLPFGETLVEEHLNSNNSPYKFNAKELDAETGWYYYGARYYDPKWSTFLTVDPLYDHPKQIGISPYAYTANNPVRYVDPDGRLFDDYEYNRETGELKLVKESNDENAPDVIYAVRKNESGEIERTGQSIEIKDTNVLDRNLGDIDFSKRGLIFEIGDLETGIKAMQFLSFTPAQGREISALGFSEKGSKKSGLFINPWDKNTSFKSYAYANIEGHDAYNLFQENTTGHISFKIHTHPGYSATPSGTPGGNERDFGNYNPQYPHYIMSKGGGSSMYNNQRYFKQDKGFLKKYF